MSRPLRIPEPRTTLHLYRHLLREASYLPRVARPFVDRQIQERFRKHQKDEAVGEQHRQRMKQAHHELRLLRASNAGDMNRMRRVLLRSFGRVGRRRRELMAEVLQREIPSNTEELQKYMAEASAIASQDRHIDWLDTWDLEKLSALARSQAQQDLLNSPKPPMTSAQTDPTRFVPAENSWGNPFHPRVARTKEKKAWKSVADKCMPPMPKEEWQRIGSIVDGSDRDPKQLPPPRRPVAQSASVGSPEAKAWNWQAYATKPVAIVDLPTNRRNKLLTGAVDDNTPTGDPRPAKCHKYTPRTWRRLLLNVWQLTSTMEQKPCGRGWDVAWGKPRFTVPPATTGNMEFLTDFPSTHAAHPGKRRRGSRSTKAGVTKHEPSAAPP
ncbi:hypothetical protein BT67DRAFT_249782 [Trichocladium antarcticum]|uniref:LYR motif-containing protein Cup1-like N-terminal domain-containing protein n=1 Tax=Trichocladium antarcticum TaxID=1450529 RepID=A0AAN6Z9U6_9PEZI|nr:hypothetical protein BT67DRAFT_249782 [Trichocladium antarcticum]